MEIVIINGDITKIGNKADAIVNAANESLLGGAGVDGAIHRAAGPLLLKECLALNGCKPGEAKATKAYNLNNKYIIHTVGPRYYSDPTPKETLWKAYINSLKIADALGVETIAFPSISTGAFAFPINEAAEICAEAFASYKSKNIKTIYMVIYYDEKTSDAYEKAFIKNNLLK